MSPDACIDRYIESRISAARVEILAVSSSGCGLQRIIYIKIIMRSWMNSTKVVLQVFLQSSQRWPSRQGFARDV